MLLEDWQPLRRVGRIRRVTGVVVDSEGPPCALGDVVMAGNRIRCLVVGLDGEVVRLMPLVEVDGLKPGDTIPPSEGTYEVPVGDALLGRVVDHAGFPVDDGPTPETSSVALRNGAPPAMRRQPIEEPFVTGLRAIDGLLTLGHGQRIGVFAGSGVGKSTLLGMIVRGAVYDRAVVCLVGERGREVREFIEGSLGQDGLARSTVVVATANEAAPARALAVEYATRLAEWHRDQGRRVLLVVDSLTRYAMALREIGLEAGELPVARGYPPSVFTAVPKLCERAGAGETGTITAIYTVLVEGDDLEEPVTDVVRATLDGHIVLSRQLTESGHFPPIDPLRSLSRLAPRLMGPEQTGLARRFRALWSIYERNADMIRVGAYARGADQDVDEAMNRMPAMRTFLRQDVSEESEPELTLEGLARALGGAL